MKIRQGRKNGRNLYLQLGREPSDSDPCLGFIIDPAVARAMLDVLNSHSELDAGELIHSALIGADE